MNLTVEFTQHMRGKCNYVNNMTDIYLLCLNIIVKINEKHRVEGKGAFKVIPELESFPFKVDRVSPFVCSGCVKKLKKRRNLITQIESIDEFYRYIQDKSSHSLKRTSDISLDSAGIKIHHGNEGEGSPSTSTETSKQQSSIPRCSSPVRSDHRLHSSDSTPPPLLCHQLSQEKKVLNPQVCV